jgi:hypothetical protein
LSLVVPVRGTTVFNLFCAGQSRSFTPPGVLFALTDALSNTSSGNGNACQLTSTPSQPYDTVNDAIGRVAYVSFPTESTVRRYFANGAIDSAFALGAVEGLCPTRIALTPDETKLVVLDDPADPNSNCNNNPARASRIAVFNAASGALLTNGVVTVANAGDRIIAQVAFGLSNNDIFVIGPFAGQYRLQRFRFADLSAPPLQSDNLVGVTLSSATLVDIGRIGTGFAVAIGGSSGKTFNVRTSEGGTDIVQFGNEVTAVATVDQNLPVGSANRIVNLGAGDQNSLSAYLTSSGILFKRDALASDPKRIDAGRFSISASDLLFTPDGFAWALSGSSLQKLDTFNFPIIQNISSVSLGTAQAFALTWVIQTP